MLALGRDGETVNEGMDEVDALGGGVVADWEAAPLRPTPLVPAKMDVEETVLRTGRIDCCCCCVGFDGCC